MRTITTMLVLIVILLLISGCSSDSVFEGVSDDSGREPLIEEASIALDDQDYNTVISLLAEVYDTTNPDPQVSRLIGSAYMGKGGIDTTGLISFAGKENEPPFNIVADTLSLYPVPEQEDDEITINCSAEDRIVLVVVDDAQFIDTNCIDDLIDYLDQAKKAFVIARSANRHTDDDEFQLGIASAVHFAFILGNAATEGVMLAPINKAAYANLSGVNASSFREEPDPATSLTSYQEDLINVYRAIQAFDRLTTEPNDVRDALADFLNDALLMPTTGIDENLITSTMTTTGIYNYVNSLATE